VPVNHDVFKDMNDAQMAWYQTQMSMDENEKWEFMRDVAEHNAMFSNPEAVRQVRESRENTYETDDKGFDGLLRDTFGRGMPDIPEDERTDLKKLLRSEDSTGKAKQYLGMELDEVSFMPYDK
jgi:hypothetical protein